MSATRVNEAIARPVRTAVQMTPAAVVTEFVDAFAYDMAEKQYLALFAILTLLFGGIQNLIENRSGKGFLRDVSVEHVPVVEDVNDNALPKDDGGL